LWPFHLPVYFVNRPGRNNNVSAARARREPVEACDMLSGDSIEPDRIIPGITVRLMYIMGTDRGNEYVVIERSSSQ
jgi:hypothetical protein